MYVLIILQLQSAFALELQQLSQAINYATERSLVVIDEFGKVSITRNMTSLEAKRADIDVPVTI